MRLPLGMISGIGLILATAACASGTGPAVRPTVGPTGPVVTPSSSSQLTITIDDGTGKTTSWTLTCDPVGGTHPDPQGACAALDNHRGALDPVPAGRACAQVYSGPERAQVAGTWRGEPISASLSRNDACQTARWNALVPLVPPGDQ
ncbi:MAG: SSI family serine proteinase inhibitor [Microlunatus sp.]